MHNLFTKTIKLCFFLDTIYKSAYWTSTGPSVHGVWLTSVLLHRGLFPQEFPRGAFSHWSSKSCGLTVAVRVWDSFKIGTVKQWAISFYWESFTYVECLYSATFKRWEKFKIFTLCFCKRCRIVMNRKHQRSPRFQGCCVTLLSPMPLDPSSFLRHCCDRGSSEQNMTILGRKNREGERTDACTSWISHTQ